MSEPRVGLFRQLVGASGLILIAATFRLWMPQSVFPAVPLLRGSPIWGDPTAWPAALDYCALAAMLGGALVMLGGGLSERWRALDLLFPIGWAASVMLDQHRIQPWAYQFAALAILLRQGRPGRGLAMARSLAIGIYAWSAIGKLDFQFVHTVGAAMVATLLGAFGWSVEPAEMHRLAGLALLLPIGELVVAALLAVRRTGRWGVVAAVAMHLLLILLLGPWGMHHQSGVLLWNGFFIGQAGLLFWPTAESPSTAVSNPAQRRPSLGAVLVGLMLVLPLGERWGYFDHWPSWALYAPHSSRATIWIPRESIEQVPPAMRRLLDRDDRPADLFVQLPVDRWSLESLGVPIYPQARFQLGVAIAIARSSSLERQIHVQLRGPANRWTGRRATRDLHGLPDLLDAADQFTLGALPRRTQ